MGVLVWVFCGLGIGAIAAVLFHVRLTVDWLAMAAVGVAGALVGGGVAHWISVSADGGINAGGFAALVGAVLFVMLAKLVLGPRRHWSS